MIEILHVGAPPGVGAAAENLDFRQRDADLAVPGEIAPQRRRASAAAACSTAIDTATTAFAPSRALFGVPSRAHSALVDRRLIARIHADQAGAISAPIPATAPLTP